MWVQCPLRRRTKRQLLHPPRFRAHPAAPVPRRPPEEPGHGWEWFVQLRCLLEHKEKVLTREALLEQV